MEMLPITAHKMIQYNLKPVKDEPLYDLATLSSLGKSLDGVMILAGRFCYTFFVSWIRVTLEYTSKDL